MQHLLTVNCQCDETRPNCRKCQIYQISCDYSAAQVESGSTDTSSTQDISNINVFESPMLLMSLSDLDSRIGQALKPAPDGQSGPPRTYVPSQTLRAFNHFV